MFDLDVLSSKDTSFTRVGHTGRTSYRVCRFPLTRSPVSRVLFPPLYVYDVAEVCGSLLSRSLGRRPSRPVLSSHFQETITIHVMSLVTYSQNTVTLLRRGCPFRTQFVSVLLFSLPSSRSVPARAKAVTLSESREWGGKV